MFIGKIIDHPESDQIKKWSIFVMLLVGAIVMGLHYFSIIALNDFILYGLYIACLGGILGLFKLLNILRPPADVTLIEIDADTVSIKRGNGRLVAQYDLSNVDCIRLKENIEQHGFKLSQEDFAKDCPNQRNALEFTRDGKQFRFDFQVESSYMINRLSKVLIDWKTSGKQLDYAA